MPLKDTGLDSGGSLSAYLGEVRGTARAAGSYVLAVRNPTEYAEALEHKDGYTVIDQPHLAATADGWVKDLVEADVPVTEGTIRLALDAAGKDEVNHLRSLTGATTEDGRGRHPGYWADDSTVLVQGYESEVLP